MRTVLAGRPAAIGASTESFLRTSAPLSPSQARADVEAARALAADGPLRELEPRLAAGDVTRTHVDVATRCLARIPLHLRATDADRTAIATYFATLAPTRHPRELQRAASALLERLAPEVADRFDPQAHERRFLDMSTDVTGMLVGRFALDPVAGAALQAAVDACAAPDPTGPDGRDARTAPQRRADALAALADRALAVALPSRGERPRVVVHATVEQLARARRAGPARTEAGTDLGPDALRRLSCDAVLQRVVWDRDGTALGSERLDLGRTARLADVHLRRALAARDRGCVVPGCGAQPAHCDAHHVVHWADGGVTALDNLALLCGSHHSAVHAGTWQVSVAADGVPEVVPPARVDPLRRPRRAPHHDLDAALVCALGADGLGAEGLGADGPGADGLGADGLGADGLGADGPGATEAQATAPSSVARTVRVRRRHSSHPRRNAARGRALDDFFVRVDESRPGATAGAVSRRSDHWLPPGMGPARALPVLTGAPAGGQTTPTCPPRRARLLDAERHQRRRRVLLARPEHRAGEVRPVGRVGQVLGLQAHPVALPQRHAVAAHHGPVEEVARVQLHPGLVGADGERASARAGRGRARPAAARPARRAAASRVAARVPCQASSRRQWS